MKNMYTMPFTFMVEVQKTGLFLIMLHRVSLIQKITIRRPIYYGVWFFWNYQSGWLSYCDIGGANRRVYESCGVRDSLWDSGLRLTAWHAHLQIRNKHWNQNSMEIYSWSSRDSYGGQTTTGLRHLNGHIKNLRFGTEHCQIRSLRNTYNAGYNIRFDNREQFNAIVYDSGLFSLKKKMGFLLMLLAALLITRSRKRKMYRHWSRWFFRKHEDFDGSKNISSLMPFITTDQHVGHGLNGVRQWLQKQ